MDWNLPQVANCSLHRPLASISSWTNTNYLGDGVEQSVKALATKMEMRPFSLIIQELKLLDHFTEQCVRFDEVFEKLPLPD
jgi:hypothetical protein